MTGITATPKDIGLQDELAHMRKVGSLERILGPENYRVLT
jgi:hypothetical protein